MTYRELLRTKADFRRLWVGQVISEIGDWFNNIAVLALTIDLAGRGREGQAVALYAVARHLPLFLFGPLAGIVADRFDRRRVMIFADVLRAALALGFLIANQIGSLVVIYLIGAALFAVSGFFNAAKRASMPNLVETTPELLTANSLSASTTAATIALGSAVGGLFSTFIGRDTVFILNAITFLLSAEMIRRIVAPTRQSVVVDRESHAMLALNATGGNTLARSRRSRSADSLRQVAVEVVEGWRYVRRNSVLWAIFVVSAVWGLGNGAARALYSIFGARLGAAAAEGIVDRPADLGISVLFIAMGAGGVLGAPIARRFNFSARKSLGSRMGRSMFLDGCGLAAFSWMPNLWGAALVLVAREINFAIWWTAQQTIIMTSAEDRYAGRVFASYETLTTLMMVTSMLVAGGFADRFGIRPVAAIGGALIGLSGLLWFFLNRSETTKH